MTLWELREAIESFFPWWTVIVVAVIGIAATIWRPR
jgi:hypothetical protein